MDTSTTKHLLATTEMNVLRNIVGRTRLNHVTNQDIRQKCRMQTKLLELWEVIYQKEKWVQEDPWSTSHTQETGYQPNWKKELHFLCGWHFLHFVFIFLLDGNSFFCVFFYICMILLSWLWCLYIQFTCDYGSCWGSSVWVYNFG